MQEFFLILFSRWGFFFFYSPPPPPNKFSNGSSLTATGRKNESNSYDGFGEGEADVEKGLEPIILHSYLIFFINHCMLLLHGA